MKTTQSKHYVLRLGDEFVTNLNPLRLDKDRIKARRFHAQYLFGGLGAAHCLPWPTFEWKTIGYEAEPCDA